MSPTLLAHLLKDLRDPAIIWQIVAVSTALLLAGLLHYWLRKRTEGAGKRVKDSLADRRTRLQARVGWQAIALLLLGIAYWPLSIYIKTSVIQVALLLLGTFIAVRLIVFALRTVFTRSTWLASFERWIAIMLWSVTALFVTGLNIELWAWLESIKLHVGKVNLSLGDTLIGMVSLLLAVLAALGAGSALESRLMKSATLGSSTKVMLARAGKAMLLVIGVLLGLALAGIDLTVLSVFGGALGVGLGLGLQRIASNYVSGFIILLDRSLKIGDLITVDKYYGKVTQINTRYTVVQAFDASEAIIPNEMLVATPVQNHSYSNRNTRIKLAVSVDYRSDVEKVITLLQECAIAHPRVVADPEPAAQLGGFGVDGFDLELYFWIADPENGQGNVRSDVARQVWKAFVTAEIQIPFPQREIRIQQSYKPESSENPTFELGVNPSSPLPRSNKSAF
jgi:small-conductance mechanosensitive channel